MIRVTLRTAVDPARAIWRPTVVQVWLGCAMALCGLPPALAQSATGPVVADAHIESMNRAQAEQAKLKALIESAPKAYEDRFMNPGTEPADDAAPEAEQPQGFRAWMVESRIGFGSASASGYGSQRATEFGQRFEYRRETLNYGEFVLQADGRHLSGDNLVDGGGIGALGYAREPTSGRFTLRNLGFPITTQTFADSAVGDIYSELTDGLGRNYRLSLGSTTVRGASMRIFNSDLDVRAGFGQRGNLAGGPYPGFEKSQGTLGWLGFTQRLGDSWFTALQLDQARDVPAYYFDPLTAQGFGRKDVTSWAASLGYGREVVRDGDFKARATLVGSSVSSPTAGVATGGSQGLFLEASARSGLYRHEFGVYTARPNLHFGDYALSTGTGGAYWRVDRSTSRMSWGAGLDQERNQADPNYHLAGYSRVGVNGNFQYLFDRDTSIGGSLNVYRTRYDKSTDPAAVSNAAIASDARSLYGNAFYQTRFFDWPRSRFTLTVRRNELLVRNDEAATGQELQWEQDWIGGRFERMRPELTTTLGYARDRSGGIARNYPTAGVQFRYWMDGGLQLGGNLRYTSQSGGLYTSRGLSGTLTAEKELAPGWRLGFAASFNQARAALVPTTFSGTNLYRSQEKSAYIYLRWEGSTGTAYQTAGMRGNGAGGGSVSGHVFFDANRDGLQQAGEGGVAGVEVLLDGRYRAITDRDGRFEFPLVTTGRHQLTLTLESVPLPWGARGDSGVSVDVPLRGQATTEIPVVKVAE
ncbi:SdrD B-like domain-containing protein [Variovorax sp. PAMC26660]|uniref:SdrD B-like domain-containing protein n=1 Tax=Variovorax sp. PAMC26660 TaxID=2762322 RepID=UPI00164E8959|nr:SdrD B-like domain-containing protein [Variovorax sp. PAMC26660]QNK69935.1 hypothetical protein H7F35_09700 [Variovorax sp. PAMC26660]